MAVYNFGYTGTIQMWTAPSNGTYKIKAYGAQGGSVGSPGGSYHEGGKGAYVYGEFVLKAGDVLYILVGQAGVSKGWSDWGGGGGGGTFVAKGTTATTYKLLAGFNQYVTPLIVAAGGGGAGDDGCSGIGNGQGVAGWGGQGRASTTSEGAGTYTSYTGAGAGFATNASAGSVGAASFLNGGAGGYWSGYQTTHYGGFGGGGTPYDGGGSGGGWHGGEANSNNTGNGGYSYNTGLNPTGIDGYQVGDGLLTITLSTNYVAKVYNFAYTGAVQSFTIPCTGTYKMECWGANGGGAPDRSTGSSGGWGGYAYGEMKFKKGDVVYIYCGGAGQYANGPFAGGGFNGGGNGCSTGFGGGGASDIRKAVDTLAARVIVAGGGGGADDYYAGGGSRGGGNDGSGGNGGGLESEGAWIDGGYYAQFRATQTSGYALGQGQNATVATDTGGGGGGYWGGLVTNNNNGGAGGGSSYIAGLANSGTMTGINWGNGKVALTLLYDEMSFFYKKGSDYYIPTQKFFSQTANSFTPLTLAQVMTEIDNDPSALSLYNLGSSFTIGSTTYNPYDYFDLTQCKLCAVPVYTRINENISNIYISYTPTPKAMSKTTIKVKSLWTPLNDDINNGYLNVSGLNTSGIKYNLDYYTLKKSVSNTCDLIDSEVLKDNFYSSFIFTSPASLLSSYGVYKIDKVTYTKIKDDYLDITDNYYNRSITFKNAYTKVLVNTVFTTNFNYYKETIDTF
jgi:hypothetical protein